MCMSRIEKNDRDAMTQYADPSWIDKRDTSKPRLMSQQAGGGLSFVECKQVKEVRIDPQTPYRFCCKENPRATQLWTAGYDLYAPSESVAYHWYETRKVVWERHRSKRYAVQLKRRITQPCLAEG